MKGELISNEGRHDMQRWQLTLDSRIGPPSSRPSKPQNLRSGEDRNESVASDWVPASLLPRAAFQTPSLADDWTAGYVTAPGFRFKPPEPAVGHVGGIVGRVDCSSHWAAASGQLWPLRLGRLTGPWLSGWPRRWCATLKTDPPVGQFWLPRVLALWRWRTVVRAALVACGCRASALGPRADFGRVRFSVETVHLAFAGLTMGPFRDGIPRRRDGGSGWMTSFCDNAG
ncbi:hypothetical protein QBC47DRAFT_2059 [Echria macrotheca]|uniref:Uncharacterized protein n=1 Tax=Echria macrotheca TaxID=438768 RepID=A0AAJ0BQG5_9PEZI|nr:hypothetical protein QBC47DRAFT_2059 [Echria macrotheca]